MSFNNDPIEPVRRYYDGKIEQHGATASGVDWKDENSQSVRFEQLALVMGNDCDCSLADIGCGYGAFATFLRKRGWRGSYEGVDISERMIEAARKRFSADKQVRLTVGQKATMPADFVVASGIFNVKMKTGIEEWESYVLKTIDSLVASARKGVAFNFLTSWSDVPFMREDLYYAAPERILEYCAARHSRWLELSQDYGLFEFTVRLRLDRAMPRLRIRAKQ
jgi:SAM-dependent methyltransferase